MASRPTRRGRGRADRPDRAGDRARSDATEQDQMQDQEEEAPRFDKARLEELRRRLQERFH